MAVGAVEFTQGNATRYDYADNNAYDSTSTLSGAVWAYWNAIGGFRMIVMKDANWYLATTGTDLLFSWYNGSGLQRGFLTPAPSSSAWHHVAWAASGDDAHKLWIDGVDLGLSPGNLGGGTRVLTNPLSVGGNPAGGGSNIRLAQLAILNGAVWTSTEIANLQTTVANEVASLSAYMSYDTPGGVVAPDDQINAITPTSDTTGGGSITAAAGPNVTSGGGGGGGNPWYAYAQMRQRTESLWKRRSMIWLPSCAT